MDEWDGEWLDGWMDLPIGRGGNISKLIIVLFVIHSKCIVPPNWHLIVVKRSIQRKIWVDTILLVILPLILNGIPSKVCTKDEFIFFTRKCFVWKLIFFLLLIIANEARQTNALKVMSIMSVIFICTHSTACDRISEYGRSFGWRQICIWLVNYQNRTQCDQSWSSSILQSILSFVCRWSFKNEPNQQPPFLLSAKYVLSTADKFAIGSEQYKRLI